MTKPSNCSSTQRKARRSTNSSPVGCDSSNFDRYGRWRLVINPMGMSPPAPAQELSTHTEGGWA